MKQAEGAYLTVAGHRINHSVLASIQDASRRTGVGFSYLMAQAQRESAFDHRADSRRSSASGLYQFTAPTWLEMMMKHGAKYGHGQLASAISVNRRGEYVVRDEATRKHILALRTDHRLSAYMAGEYANDNRIYLQRRLGREPTNTDLYLAHFLGPAGALRFLEACAEDPRRSAASVVPAAARANPGMFYGAGRKAHSVAAVYDSIRNLIERPMRRYTHLERVDPVAAPYTENIETGRTFAPTTAGQLLAEVREQGHPTLAALNPPPKPEPAVLPQGEEVRPLALTAPLSVVDVAAVAGDFEPLPLLAVVVPEPKPEAPWPAEFFADLPPPPPVTVDAVVAAQEVPAAAPPPEATSSPQAARYAAAAALPVLPARTDVVSADRVFMAIPGPAGMVAAAADEAAPPGGFFDRLRRSLFGTDA